MPLGIYHLGDDQKMCLRKDEPLSVPADMIAGNLVRCHWRSFASVQTDRKKASLLHTLQMKVLRRNQLWIFQLTSDRTLILFTWLPIFLLTVCRVEIEKLSLREYAACYELSMWGESYLKKFYENFNFFQRRKFVLLLKIEHEMVRNAAGKVRRFSRASFECLCWSISTSNFQALCKH